uniref:Clathrin binding box of aftiphilin containing 1 n=1 Tax=Rousettus aegyptiacus TaxID=9407 RepID=A0A7J8B7F3_ROUAE|nr:clathrin binding box of aftiphilin containing 1 [Rousettus aegyptiacus]
MRPGDTNMQGLRELGGELGGMPLLSGSLSDLLGEAGEVALCQASEDGRANEAAGSRSLADVEGLRKGSQLSPAPEARISGLSGGFSTCTTLGPDPVEHSNAWGEFEGFRESSAKSEQFSQSFELPERATAAQSSRPTSHKQHGSQPPPQGGPWVTGTAAISPSEPAVSYEKIFRFAFQEVPVEQTAEGVPTLDRLLEAGSEGAPGLGPESRGLRAALHHADGASSSRYLWDASRCRQNFLLVLGVDSAQRPCRLLRAGTPRPGRQGPPSTSSIMEISKHRRHGQAGPEVSGSEGHAVEGAEPREPGGAGACGVHPPGCGVASSRGELSGTPGGRPGGLVTRSHGDGRCGSAPGKAFGPRSLHRALFHSDVC